MKRIALLLAFVFLFTVFVSACNKDTADENSNSSMDNATENGSETSLPDSLAKKFAVVTRNPVAESPKATVISNGASYVKSAEAHESYPDVNGVELTDGVTGVAVDSYSNETLSGYNGAVDITVDLGDTYDKIYGFRVGFFTSSDVAIGTPVVSVSASLDNDKFYVIDTLTLPEIVDGTSQTAELIRDKYVNARYIKFSVKPNSSWAHIDEVTVIADAEDEGGIKYLESVNAAYDQIGTVTSPITGNDIDLELNKVLVSQGASYTVTGTIDTETYPDVDSKMLTDGKFSGYSSGETWVGFVGGADSTVKIDLGKTVADIAAIEASFFVNSSVRTYAPVALKIASTDAKGNRTELGVIYPDVTMQYGNCKFNLPLAKTVSARYIEITLVATESKLHLVEEFAVYAYRDESAESLYPDVVIENGATEWGSEESSDYVNLISGLTQQIITDSEPDAEYFTSEHNTPVTSKFLTDGVKVSGSTNHIHDDPFFKFYLGSGRKIIYDLGHLSSVDKFTAGFSHRSDWAVMKPNYVSVAISPNGSDWYDAGSLELEGNGTNDVYRGELVLDKKVKARYIVFIFNVGTWAACDELEVFGTKSISGASEPSSVGLEKISLFAGGRIEPSDELLGGAKDLCLLYHTDDELYYTVEDLIPYLAYVDEDGTIKDVMFDSFVFLYDNTTFPSGGRPHENAVLSDWQWCINDIFTEGRNIYALDEAAGQVKEALGLDSDFTYKVTLTLYYPHYNFENPSSTKDFGDVDGDGVAENFKNYEDRIKAIEWYIDELEAKYAEADFKNIEFVGYYWWHEAIENDDTDSKEMLNDISDYVHSLDRDFFWIPYYTSNGYNQWAEYGFDIACMQPNYVFQASAPYSKIVNCAKLTALYGMGFEMEISSDALHDELYFKRYMEYLASGNDAELGYMNDTVNMYYQSVYIFRDAAYSDELMARTIYETTYHYIKGDIQYKPEVLTGLTFTAEKNKIFNGTISFEDNKLRKFALAVTADRGSVTMNNDGTFTYYPEKDYIGEVEFSFIYSEYLGWSDPCEVIVNIQ